MKGKARIKNENHGVAVWVIVALATTLQAATIRESFESQALPSTDMPPAHWIFMDVENQAGTYYEAVTRGEGVAGRVKADVVVDEFFAAGYIVHSTGIPGAMSFSGSFDLLLEDEGSWSDGLFMFGDILTGHTAEYYKLKFVGAGNSTAVFDSHYPEITQDNILNTSASLNFATWYTTYFTWTPTTGTAGTMALEVQAPDDTVLFAASIELTLPETVYFGFGSSNDAIRVDNVAILYTDPAQASSPSPQDGHTDAVAKGLWLSWTPGVTASTHDVYLGASFEDVNTATVPAASGLDANSFDPGRLDFGGTYFWRVDEVNGTPDKTVFKGDIWSFVAEPYSIPIDGASIVVTASSVSNEFSMPEKTLDGSGLGDNNTHTIQTETMWFTAMGDMAPWIQYEFQEVKKLDTMKVWNSNSSAEGFVGYGVKGVVIETSKDGDTWDLFEDVNEFSRAPGVPTYNQYDEIDFGGVAAKRVRLSIQSNWGGFMQSYSLSEVQFTMIPAAAREPVPAPGSVEVSLDRVLTWRAGRDADQHLIYLTDDPNAVVDGLASSVTSNSNSVDFGLFDPQLGTTYYWRVDEVNEAEATPLWTGPVWRLDTLPALAVDDFEGYSNESPDRPFQTWLDGFGYSADVFFPAGYAGNGTGSGVGHDIWSGSSPHYNGQIIEGTIVKGGGQSLPLYFNNTNGVSLSETEITFAQAQDWSANGIKSLSLFFYGDPGNRGQLYLKINGTRIDYVGLPDALQRTQWLPWNIDLSQLGGTRGNVTSLTMGIDGSGASGVIYIDEIYLYPKAAVLIEPVMPADSDPNLVAYYEFNGNADDSQGHYPGTVAGEPEYLAGQAGQTGQAIRFDGVDDHVVYDFVQDEVWSAYSVSLWVKTETFAQGQYSGLFNTDSAASDFQFDADGSDPGHYRHRGAVNTILGPMTAEWIHLAASCDGLQTSVYYNGLLVAITATADTQLGQIGLGGNRGFTEHFAGMIDEVRLYNRALSSEEVAGLSGVTVPFPKTF